MLGAGAVIYPLLAICVLNRNKGKRNKALTAVKEQSGGDNELAGD